jgi:hypothetical protein
MSNQRACDRASPSWRMLFRFSSRSNTILSHPSHRPQPPGTLPVCASSYCSSNATRSCMMKTRFSLLPIEEEKVFFRIARDGRSDEGGDTHAHTKEKTPPRVKCPSRYYTQSDRPVLFVIPSLPWRFLVIIFFYFRGVSIEKNKNKNRNGYTSAIKGADFPNRLFVLKPVLHIIRLGASRVIFWADIVLVFSFRIKPVASFENTIYLYLFFAPKFRFFFFFFGCFNSIEKRVLRAAEGCFYC